MPETTTLTIERAQTQANIVARAESLFDTGYRMNRIGTEGGLFIVFPPQVQKPAYIVDTAADYCSCPCHKDHGFCKHRLAVEKELDADRRGAEATYWEEYGRHDQAAGKF